jgi:hypothetical protein
VKKLQLFAAAKEALWLHSFLKEIRGLHNAPLTICDNQGAIALSKDNKFHARDESAVI